MIIALLLRQAHTGWYIGREDAILKIHKKHPPNHSLFLENMGNDSYYGETWNLANLLRVIQN